MVVRNSLCWRGEELAHSEHLVLVRTKEGYTLARVLQQGLVESADSLIAQENIRVF
jgi:MOSC domain-containing protein YiiM